MSEFPRSGYQSIGERHGDAPAATRRHLMGGAAALGAIGLLTGAQHAEAQSPEQFVTLDTAQIVTGPKTFTPSSDAVVPLTTSVPSTSIADFASFKWGGTELASIRPRKTLDNSGDEVGRGGTLRLYDRIDNRILELGPYAYGMGLFTPDSLFEFFSQQGVSIRTVGANVPFLTVRNNADTSNAIYMRGDSFLASQERAIKIGFGPGGFAVADAPTEIARFTSAGNLGIGITPSARLHVKGGSVPMSIFEHPSEPRITLNKGSTTHLSIGHDGTAGYITVPSATPLALMTASKARITIGAAGQLGFFGAAAVSKPRVSGSRGGNAALTSVLAALVGLGLITDSSI